MGLGRLNMTLEGNQQNLLGNEKEFRMKLLSQIKYIKLVVQPPNADKKLFHASSGGKDHTVDILKEHFFTLLEKYPDILGPSSEDATTSTENSNPSTTTKMFSLKPIEIIE